MQKYRPRTIDTDNAGRDAHNAIFGDRITANRVTDISVAFFAHIDTTWTRNVSTNSGTAIQSNGMAILQTTSMYNAVARLEASHALHYRVGFDTYGMLTTTFMNSGFDNITQWAGMLDNQNGFAFGYYNRNFAVLHRRGGVDNVVIQNSFNMDKLNGTGQDGNVRVDPSKFRLWRISYGWLGAAPAIFEVHTEGRWLPFHRFTFTDSAQPSILNPAVPLMVEITKTSSSAELVEVGTGSWNGGTIGGDIVDTPMDIYTRNNAKTIVGNTLTNILTLQVNSTFHATNNGMTADFVFMGASCDGVKPVDIYIVRNMTVTSAAYTAVDSQNSFVSYDTSGTLINSLPPQSGIIEMVIPLGKAGQSNMDVSNFATHIHKGETLTFAANSPQASDVSVSVRWQER